MIFIKAPDTKLNPNIQYTWDEARADCEMEGGDIISLHSEQEANLVAQKTSQGYQNFWTGLARGGDGSFSWVDGTPYDFEFWLDGEPNSQEGDYEDCVEAYYMTAQWNDAYCTDYKGVVCMIDPGIETRCGLVVFIKERIFSHSILDSPYRTNCHQS